MTKIFINTMKSLFTETPSKQRLLMLAVLLTALSIAPTRAMAGSNGSTPGQQIGHGGRVDFGDYVGIALDAPYRYLIEVPPGTPMLVVDILDADIGDNSGNRDEIGPVDGSFNTSVNYEVFDPDGVSVGTLSCGPGTCAGSNNTWTNVVTLASPDPGHWVLVVDMSSSVTSGDDGNGYAVRAHDGDETAGGIELNVYALSYAPPGFTNLPDSTDTDVYFPYITSGCHFDSNEFDFDTSAVGHANAIDFVSRSGAFTQGFSSLGETSGNNVWLSTTLTGFTNAGAATDYGIWRAEYTLDDVGSSNDNWATVYIGAFDAAAPDPTSQPEANSHRLYLATDSDGTPVKPWMGHSWKLLSGEPALEMGIISRVEVTLEFHNPTPFPVQFDASTGGSNVITAGVPANAGQTTYVLGSLSIDSGGSSAIVAESGSGPWFLEFAPGVIAAGTTATMSYRIDVTPTSADFDLAISGTPGFGGTQATYLDETCADASGGSSMCSGTAQYTSTFTFGPLCQLIVTSSLFADGFESGDVSKWSASTSN